MGHSRFLLTNISQMTPGGIGSHGDLWVKMFRSDYIVNFRSLIGIQGLSPFV